MEIKVTYPKGSFGAEKARSFEFDLEFPPSDEGGFMPISAPALLEAVFRHMNRVDGSETHLDEWKCRSMCVGDVVEFDGGAWRCTDVGWEEIIDSSQIDSPAEEYNG